MLSRGVVEQVRDELIEDYWSMDSVYEETTTYSSHMFRRMLRKLSMWRDASQNGSISLSAGEVLD